MTTLDWTTERRPPAGGRHDGGFTRTDLVFAAGMAGVLALLPLAGANSSQNQSRAGTCAENLRQITRAWQVYAGDFNGALAPSTIGSTASPRNWVSGWLDYSTSPANTNKLFLTDRRYAAMGPYIGSAAWFSCPEDFSTVRYPSGFLPRVRSYSMNCYVGTGAMSSSVSTAEARLQNQSQVRQPSQTFVLLDERAESINDPTFMVEMIAAGSQARINDFPGNYHYGGANLSFADGHTELWRWLDPRTRPPTNERAVLALGVASPSNPDVARLQSVTTYFR